MDPETKRLELWLQMGRFAITASVTLILTLVFAWGFIAKNIDNQVFTQAVGMVLAFWFGAATGGRMPTTPSASTTTTTETDPSGAKREVTMTAPPGAAAPSPVPLPTVATPAPDPPKGATT